MKPQPKYRIWVDQDGVLYDMFTPWLQMHNDEHPEHQIKEEDITQFDVSNFCKDRGCNGNLYKYFEKKAVWEVGGVVGNSQEIIKGWIDDNIAKIGVLTSTVNALALTALISFKGLFRLLFDFRIISFSTFTNVSSGIMITVSFPELMPILSMVPFL